MTKGVAFGEISTRKASETPYEIELVDSEGAPLGMFVSVLGQHCDTVTSAINAALNERRKMAAIAEARNAKARPDSADFTKIEDDVAFGQRLSAVRMCNWRRVGETDGLTAEQVARFQGASDEFTPARALAFCQNNPEWAQQVLDASNRTSNFMKVSSQT